MKIKLQHSLTFILTIGIFYGCSVTKYIPENERLYTGSKLILEPDSIINNQSDLETELEKVIQPKPNSSFLGMRLGLYYHYKNQQEKPGFINRWLYKKFGEKPFYQSDVETYEIENLLLNRLENRGFFYSSAASQFEETEHKASATYTLKVRKPYRMVSYQLDSMPSTIYYDIKEIKEKSPLKENMRFDLSNFKIERQRIDNNLKNKGYYNFDDTFLIFEADTNQYSNKRFDLFLKLKKEVPKKSIIPYKIDKVNIYTNYEVGDSIENKTIRFNNKNYIQEEVVFKPKYLDPFVKLEEGQFYSPELSKNTARRLSTIGAYKYVNIQYKETDTIATDSIGLLESNIYLSPLNKRAIRAELQLVTKSNNFTGPAIGVTFSNRNLFGGGETLNTTAKLGYETQLGAGNTTGKSSLELGLKNELIFPRVIFPIKINENFFKYDIPKTKTSINLDYLNRSDLYTLLSATALFGYSWDGNRYITHQINPVSINYTRLSNTTPEFEDILNENPFLERSFEQQFISGFNYSFTYNGLVDTQKRHQFYFNTTLDVAGNSVSLFGKVQNPDKPKTFLGLEYAQYAKADFDFHYHLNFGNEKVLAARVFAGYGLAYGNSNVVPYVKQYFSGGPYSVRAFAIRSLGPGTYNEEADSSATSFFDKTGNIRLEGNLEYRFPLFSFFKGAVFADAGNIWNSGANPAFNGTDTFSSNFLNELGMGAGFGLRIDIQNFVIRFDLAAPFHDPSLPEGQRLDFNLNESVFNFAIGYPF